jgi:hypothetical protein
MPHPGLIGEYMTEPTMQNQNAYASEYRLLFLVTDEPRAV